MDTWHRHNPLFGNPLDTCQKEGKSRFKNHSIPVGMIGIFCAEIVTGMNEGVVLSRVKFRPFRPVLVHSGQISISRPEYMFRSEMYLHGILVNILKSEGRTGNSSSLSTSLVLPPSQIIKSLMYNLQTLNLKEESKNRKPTKHTSFNKKGI